MGGTPTHSRSVALIPKTGQTVQEFQAEHSKLRFFYTVKAKLQGIEALMEVDCIAAAHDAAMLLVAALSEEGARRGAERIRQLELEGLLTPSDRAAVNQREFRL